MRTTFWFPLAGQQTWNDSTSEKSEPSAEPKLPQESGYHLAYESSFEPKPVNGVTVNGIYFSPADLRALAVAASKKKE